MSLLHCRWVLYQLSSQGSPCFWMVFLTQYLGCQMLTEKAGRVMMTLTCRFFQEKAGAGTPRQDRASPARVPESPAARSMQCCPAVGAGHAPPSGPSWPVGRP